MVKITSVLQTANFKRAVKKLHQNQKKDLDKAVKELIDAPLLGEQKRGDLAFSWVSLKSHCLPTRSINSLFNTRSIWRLA